MIKNKPLKEQLDLLSQMTFSLYERELHSNAGVQDDSPSVSMALQTLDEQVRDIPAFRTCVRLMAEDDKIKALQGKLVGTSAGAALIENESTCVLSFLKLLYSDSRDITESCG